MRSYEADTGSSPAGATAPTIAVIGANHRNTPIRLRERLSIPPGELPAALERVCAVEGVTEAVVLSTCNRAELYAALEGGREVLDQTASALWGARGVGLEEVGPSLYRHEGIEAARHLFRVACGLDSMVPGENEVLGQVRAAYLAAVDAGAAGAELSRLFQRTFKVAKDVRSRTGLSRRKVSVATVVVELAQKVFGSLKTARVLLVGAGEVAELALKALASENAPVTAVANRSVGSAERLAAQYGARAVPLDKVASELPGADILVASTAAGEPVITARDMEKVIPARRGRPVLLVDLGVPRNIEAAVADLGGVILYNIDDLQEVVSSNVAYRLEQAGRARALIDDEVEKYAAVLRTGEVSHTISELCSELSLIAEDECRRTLGRLGEMTDGGLTDEQRQEVSLLAKRIVGKILHSPITALKEEARGGNGAEMDRWVRRLFGM
jgi:glutamyl-tRNA reductase